ncbi:hypothetical protein IMG5_164960 [Ichthyophthirius multifiliis]|uniref:Transmembrane protein n=1 Tax=Ichthyophthirius multifiliis TaxID=5932 RepID=G0R0H6_ICHMU|nr:hypothetical protein IMG5_164960 [Ichthyophthirius multifiliis]EGR29027.1 hypothetical protein IMG5_164960 [Ichthyophthirius multifiliis]|eukprot:XP_004030263.1 hypothetical protein IMG5_164960 [Ichthyophthirius multifiliis]
MQFSVFITINSLLLYWSILINIFRQFYSAKYLCFENIILPFSYIFTNIKPFLQSNINNKCSEQAYIDVKYYKISFAADLKYFQVSKLYVSKQLFNLQAQKQVLQMNEINVYQRQFLIKLLRGFSSKEIFREKKVFYLKINKKQFPQNSHFRIIFQTTYMFYKFVHFSYLSKSSFFMNFIQEFLFFSVCSINIYIQGLYQMFFLLFQYKPIIYVCNNVSYDYIDIISSRFLSISGYLNQFIWGNDNQVIFKFSYRQVVLGIISESFI